MTRHPFIITLGDLDVIGIVWENHYESRNKHYEEFNLLVLNKEGGIKFPKLLSPFYWIYRLTK